LNEGAKLQKANGAKQHTSFYRIGNETPYIAPEFCRWSFTAGLLLLVFCCLPFAFCPLPFAFCFLPFALCPFFLAFCLLPFCPLPFFFCFLPFAFQSFSV